MTKPRFTKPILILAFNRPAHVKNLIDSLRPQSPEKILVGIDGPRLGNLDDVQKIREVLNEVRKIDWTDDVEILKRDKNLGLRFAVAEAVTWAIDKYGEVIVVEDDVEVGPEFLSFMNHMLEEYKNDLTIGHISGYTIVPQKVLQTPHETTRLSLIPVSYAWATWKRAWKLYDPELNWASAESVLDLRLRLNSLVAAIIWKINFFDASKENINTWAYRWLATLWENNLLCIEPNRNLVAYKGHSGGTHTRSKVSIPERPIERLPKNNSKPEYDPLADQWLLKKTFRGTPVGLVRRFLESFVLGVLRFIRVCKSRSLSH